MNKKVVITGMGLLAPKSKSPEELFELIKEKKSTITVNEEFHNLGFRLPFASVLTQAELNAISSNGDNSEDLNRASKISLYTAGEAIKNSKLDISETCRKGVFVGCNKIMLELENLSFIINEYDRKRESVDFNRYIKRTDRHRRNKISMNQDQPALLISEKYNFQDFVLTHGDACAAGNISIGNAYRYIKNNELDVAIAGGTECSVTPFGYYSFNLLHALYAGNKNHKNPSEACRPFDKDRCGLVMGEGSAFVILESEEHAKNRNAEILCEVKGFYKTAEAVRITSTSLDGSEYTRCMKGALSDAGLPENAIDHINAHGTSTVLGDLCEANSIHSLFNGNKISVTSNKSAIGHTFGASGAIEAVLSIKSLINQGLLPTLNYESPKNGEPELDIVKDYRQYSLKNILSNSFGLCGTNSSIILGLGE